MITLRLEVELPDASEDDFWFGFSKDDISADIKHEGLETVLHWALSEGRVTALKIDYHAPTEDVPIARIYPGTM